MGERSRRSHQRSRMAAMLRRVIMVSVAIGSAFAIAALLGGDFGRTQGQIIATSFSLAGGSVLVLACTTAWERARLGPLPSIGSVAAAAGVAMLIVAIWGGPDSEELAKAIGTAFIVGAGIALLSLFELAHPARRYEWLVGAARVLVGIVGAYSMALVWWEDPAEWVIRIFGVFAVLLAAATISVPAMHLAMGEPRAPSVPSTANGVRFCPMCGAETEAEIGEPATCPSCSSRFIVRTRVSAGGS